MLISRAWQLPPAAGAIAPGREPRLTLDGRPVINLCAEGDLALAEGPLPAPDEARPAERLAALKRAPGAVLLGSLDEALGSALRALCGDAAPTIVLDAGVRPELRALCAATASRVLDFAHLDEVDARSALGRARAHGAPVVLATEGVFGTDGTVAPLAGLVAAARELGAQSLLDDSFAFGLLGPHGAGSARHFGTGRAVALDAEVASLAGAYGLDRAAFAAYPGVATGHAALDAGAACRLDAALAQMAAAIEPQERIWALTRYLREGLNAFDLDTGDTHSPITPVLCGSPDEALDAADRLLAAGVLVHVVPAPRFADGQAALRATVSRRHDEDDLEQAIEIIAEVLA